MRNNNIYRRECVQPCFNGALLEKRDVSISNNVRNPREKSTIKLGKFIRNFYTVIAAAEHRIHYFNICIYRERRGVMPVIKSTECPERFSSGRGTGRVGNGVRVSSGMFGFGGGFE